MICAFRTAAICFTLSFSTALFFLPLAGAVAEGAVDGLVAALRTGTGVVSAADPVDVLLAAVCFKAVIVCFLFRSSLLSSVTKRSY